MCEQCLVNPLYFGEVVPGWFLIRARRASDDMKVGEWGLVQVNDPAFTWSSKIEPFDTESEDVLLEESPSDFYDGICSLDLDTLTRLIVACERAGYVAFGDNAFKDFNSLDGWLWRKIVEHLKVAAAETEEDPFPHLDAIQPHDYSLGKD